MPLFSVIIPVYNRPAEICRAVESVLGQTCTDYELIVVDDGSTDNTPAVLEKYHGALRVVRQPNRGVSAARNAGIRAAAGEWLALLDSDDQWLPRKLEDCAGYIHAHPACRIFQTGEIWIRNGRRVNQMNKHRKEEGDLFERSQELCLISPSCVLLQRSLADEEAMFDERLPVCEDYELWLRLTARLRIGLLDAGLTLKFGGHADQLSRSRWGIDRFRLFAQLELLHHCSYLDARQRDAVLRSIMQRCAILHKGAQAHGNIPLEELLAGLMADLEAAPTSRRDYQLLVQG